MIFRCSADGIAKEMSVAGRFRGGSCPETTNCCCGLVRRFRPHRSSSDGDDESGKRHLPFAVIPLLGTCGFSPLDFFGQRACLFASH
jgi:hypothetical protein